MSELHGNGIITFTGRIVAGFGDELEVEPLVEAGITPLTAIEIVTSNGARSLGEDANIGSILVGKQSDLMIVRGNRALTSAK